MEYEIIKINETTYRIENTMVRFFLLLGKEKALVIDTGMTLQNVKEIIRSITDLELVLVNTHADPDHIGGNKEFDTFYMHSLEEANYRMMGGKGNFVSVKEGDRFDLGDRQISVIHTPGHTPGSIALLDETNRMLFSGDPIQDGQIFMFGPMRNVDSYIESLDKIYTMKDKFDTIYPSHGTCPISISMIPALKEDVKDIVEGKVAGKEIEMHGQKTNVYKTNHAVFLMK